MSLENVKAKRIVTLVIWISVLLAVCVGVSYFVTRLMVGSDPSWKHVEAHGHHWLHEQLALTEEEVEAVDAFEPNYRSERSRLLAEFDSRIEKLRELLVEQDRFSPQVNASIHELHAVHGALQELSIRHYYDMMSVLPPEKKERLKKLAVEALSEPE